MSDRVPAPEFSHPVRIDAVLRTSGRPVTLDADAAARAALTKRLGLLDLEKLDARLTLKPSGSRKVKVTGTVSARVVQPCVVSLEPVTTEIEAEIALRLVPEEEVTADAGLLEDEDDVQPYDGDTVDLGEIVTQTLSLHLPDFPRAPSAQWADRIEDDGDGRDRTAEDGARENPFAKLAVLKGGKDEGGKT